MEMNDFLAMLEGMGFYLVKENEKLVLKGDRNKLSEKEIDDIKRNYQIIDYIRNNKQALMEHIAITKAPTVMHRENIVRMYRLSSLQEGILFHALYEQGQAYIMQFVCDLMNLQPEAFCRSWEHLLKRHTILRSGFYYDAFSIPVQCVYREAILPVEILDFSDLDEESRSAALERYKQEDRSRPFDLKSAPLMRLALIRLNKEQYQMIWTHHHIILDGWSQAVLIQELLDIYDRIAWGKPLSVLEEDCYEDYIRYIEKRAEEQEEAYWREYLSSLTSGSQLPFINVLTKQNKGLGDYREEELWLDTALTDRITSCVGAHRLTVNTLMQGVWAYLLYGYTGDPDVTYGVTVSGRPEGLPGIESRVGMYINTLPLYTFVNEDQTVKEWLHTIQQGQVKSRAYQHTALIDIQRWTAVQGDLFDSVLVFENYPVSRDMTTTGSGLKWMNVQTHERSIFPLSITIAVTEKIMIRFGYNANLLESSCIEQIKMHFGQVLDLMVDNVAGRLADIRLPAAAEQQLLFSRSRSRASAEAVESELSDKGYVAPRTETEQQIADIWQEILEVEQVGVYDDFFQLGGDSIKIISVVSRLQKLLKREVKMYEVYQARTLELQAALVMRYRLEGNQPDSQLQGKIEEEIAALKNAVLPQLAFAAQIADIYPMSDIQRGMAYASMLEPEQAIYHDQMIFPPFKDLDIDMFQQAFALLVEKHSILRTAFDLELHEEGLQVVYKQVPVMPDVINIQQADKEEARDIIKSYLTKERNNPFRFNKAPLWRITIFNQADYSTVAFQCHHALLDGWSVAALSTELNNLYLSLAAGEKQYLAPPLKCTYKDFIIQSIVEKRSDSNKKFWETEMKGYRRLDIFTQKEVYQRAVRAYDADFIALLRKRTAKDHISLKGLLFGASLFTISMLTSEEELTVGLVTNNRPAIEDGDKLLGCFLNTIPFRFKKENNVTWRTYFERVEEKLKMLKEKDRSTLFEIARMTGERASENPFFDVFFNFVNFHVFKGAKSGLVDEAALKEMAPDEFSVNERANTYLDWTANVTGDALTLFCSLKRELVSGKSPDYILDCFEAVIRCYLDHYEATINSNDIIPWQERRQLQETFNGAAGYTSDRTVIELFEEQATKTPEAIAVACGEKQLTYRELDARSNQLGHYLKKKGIEAGTLVPVCIGRSIEMVIGVLGILKAGGAYVPVDPDYPRERKCNILEDTSAAMVISSSMYTSGLLSTGIEVIQLDAMRAVIEKEPVSPVASDIHLNHLAYVIYTSGSTGTPKGVMVRHGNLSHFLRHVKDSYIGSDKLVMPFIASNVFDISLFQLFTPLLSGGSSVIADKEELQDLDKLVQVLQNVTAIDTVPGMYRLLVNHIRERNLSSSFRHIKKLFIGGDHIPDDLLVKLSEQFSAATIIVTYGPTEGTIFCTYLSYKPGSITTEAKGSIIGRPVAGAAIYILDKELSLLPVGVEGEIFIGGAGVSRGYLNRPDLTAARYVNNPYAPGTVLYKTGDKGRWREDGLLEFRGRNDDQVKVRGYRIEPGEIEHCIKTHEGIEEVVVTVIKTKDGEKALAVYYIIKKELLQSAATVSPQELQALLESRLPSYMIPGYFVEMEKFPLTSNGKIDRHALPAPGEVGGDSNYTAPRNETESRLVNIWQRLLNVERIGIMDDFFELGGHSLLAMRLVSVIRKALEVELNIKELFTYTTISRLSDYLQGKQKGILLSAITSRKRPDRIPLSFGQERLWFIDQLEGSVQYHIPVVLRIQGDLDESALEYAFQMVIGRHEVLRTVIEQEEGQAWQRVQEKDGWRLSIIDNAEYGSGHISAFIGRPFDLSKDYMLRASLIKSAPRTYILVLVLHHIVSDGWSMPILIRELVEAYEAYKSGRALELPPLSVQYADYAIWQRQYLEDKVLGKQLDYWERQLSGVSPLQLPLDYPRPAAQSTSGGVVSFKVGAELTRQLRHLSQEQGTTLFMTLLTVFKLLMFRYSGQEDICIGCPAANRTLQETEGLIGFFVNPLALRTRLDGNDSFISLLQRVKKTTLMAYEHQDVPFEKVIEAVVKKRDKGVNPLFQVFFEVGYNVVDIMDEKLGGVEIMNESLELPAVRFDIGFFLSETQDGLLGRLEYRTDLFRKETLMVIGEHYESLLQSVVEAPGEKIEALCQLAPTAHYPLLSENDLFNFDFDSKEAR